MNPTLQRLFINRRLMWIIIGGAVWSAILIACKINFVQGDIWSYNAAWDRAVGQGQIDLWRTPLFPLLVGIIQRNFTSAGIVAIQWLVMLISLRYVYLICRAVSGREGLSLILTAFWVFFPRMAMAAGYAGTESLSCSFTVFLAWELIIGWKEGVSRKRASWIAVWAALLFLLRPGAIAILPGLGLYAAVYLWKKKVYRWRPAVAFLSVVALVLAYCAGFYQRFGTFESSAISSFNKLIIAVEGGFADLNIEVEGYDIPDEFRNDVWQLTLDGQRGNFEGMFNEYPLPMVEAYVDATYREHFSGYMSYIAANIKRYAMFPAVYRGWYEQPWDAIGYFSSFTIGVLMTLMGAYPFVMWYYRRRGVMVLSWPCVAVWLMGCVGIVSFVFFAFYEWDRLFYPYMISCTLVVARMFAPIRIDRTAVSRLLNTK